MRRPPVVLTLLSVLLLALGTTAGAGMSVLAPQIRAYATERIFAARDVHYLSGSRDYDADVVAGIVFTVEAGLSFLHTHAEGMGLVLLFASTVVASVVRQRRFRTLLYWLLGLAFLFPIGYAVYSALVLVLGRDRGVALAERLVLIPFGTSSIVGLGLLAGVLVLLIVTGQRRALDRAADDVSSPPAWRAPGRFIVLMAAVLLTVAELAGASIGRFKPGIDAYVTARAVERPDVHGLVGLPDVDKEILDELRVKHDSALRLFHLHAQGLGLILFAAALVTRSYVRRRSLRRALDTVVALGAFGFCIGYLVWAGALPFLGLPASRALAVRVALVPAGTLLLLGLWSLTALLAADLRTGRRGAVDVQARALELPPMLVVVLSMMLLVLAEVGGGAMVPLKVDLNRFHRAQIEERPQVHRLVGLRQIDGPVVDELLSRSDFALRLFHLHAEGMALVIFAGGVMAWNGIRGRLARAVVSTLLAVGGFFYPFGYLAWGWLIPIVGLRAARDLVETFLWMPFGGAALVATGLLAIALGSQLFVGREGRRVASVLVLAVVVGAVGPAAAHHVGAFVPKDDDVSRNFKEIKFAVEAGRFDLALRLFDDGVIHATMEKEEKRLPRGLEDALRAALRGKDSAGVELRLAVFLTFMTRERLAFARERLRRADLTPERRQQQVRRVLDAAWRYYNLADFAVVTRDAKTSAALRLGFEDAYTYLGGAMVDPMWAGAASAGASRVDEAKAAAVIGRLIETSAQFITRYSPLTGSGRDGRTPAGNSRATRR